MLLDFAAANLQLNRYIQSDKLKEAFNFLDKDKDGIISVEELEMLFGPVVDKEILNRIMQEGNSNMENKLKLEDFILTMEKYKSHCDSSHRCDSN